MTTVTALRRGVAEARRAGGRVALVPTMGALHDGHLALVRAARRACDHVVVSIFVNPLQFAPGEDYESYPRDLSRDEAVLAGLGDTAPDLLYVPTVEEMYPRQILTTVTVRGVTAPLCGATRPGHFDGVTTVVSKLMHQAAPDAAFFGRKDYQQLKAVERMVADLDIPVEVVGVRTVREPDGVAISSRNAYLDPDERRAARCLSAALAAAVAAARTSRARGARPDPGVLRAVAADTIAAEPRATVDYVDVVDPETLAAPDGPRGELLVAVAARVGPARLIDNVVVGDEDDEQAILAAVRGGAGRSGSAE